MQYPQIQFYRGSLVRLANGQLKQVQDLNSDDFLESARLTNKLTNTSRHSLNSLNSPCQSPGRMEVEEADQEESQPGSSNQLKQAQIHLAHQEPDDEDLVLDVVGDEAPMYANHHKPHNQLNQQQVHIESSVVRDLLQVNGPQAPHSPASSTGSWQASLDSQPTSCSSSSNSINYQNNNTSTNNINCLASGSSVLIKLFLESTRSVVFIEVPTEHPFFVFHRGWSSWNPQRTYDKFGLKCRKLKIGDTCISLIRQQTPNKHIQLQQNNKQQQESDQCNILFSSIRLNE